MSARWILTILFVSMAHHIQAMVYDNRYLPLIQKPLRRDCNAWVQWQLEPFFMKGHEAFADAMDEGYDATGDEVGLFAFTGFYNQGIMEQAALKDGLIAKSTLPTYISQRSLPILWELPGLLEAQGGLLTWYVPCGKYGGFGGQFGFIRLHSLLAMERSRKEGAFNNGSPGDDFVIDQSNTQLLEQLNLAAVSASDAGLMDTELYGRFGIIGEYSHKLRNYDAGIQLGVIFPSAVRRNFTNPASIPAGGDGRWGIYISGDCRLELKEDWIFGMLARVNKRFVSTRQERITIITEPTIYGVATGPLRTNPGVTGIFSPYFELTSIRQGLGARLQYTIIGHAHDQLEDRRIDPKASANIKLMQNRSSWVMEVLSATVLYNFADDDQKHTHVPQISLSWDVPINILAARRVAKTHAIALTIEWNI